MRKRILKIAKIFYEIVREISGDNTQKPWEQISDIDKRKMFDSVLLYSNNPNMDINTEDHIFFTPLLNLPVDQKTIIYILSVVLRVLIKVIL